LGSEWEIAAAGSEGEVRRAEREPA